MTDFSHSFAVCAYKESPYLKDCLRSLKEQSIKARFFIATSTPNQHIKKLAEEFEVPLFEGTHESGIGRDWNFAYSCANTDLVTIAHQDDLYDRDYLKNIATYSADAKDPILYYTDYGELRAGQTIFNNKLLNVKRKMNALIKPKKFWNSKFMRNRMLSIGNPICCPSVCLNKKRFPNFRFDETMTCSLDWEAWIRLAREEGAFVYIPKPLMLHRIHEQSETTAQLEAGKRKEEDLALFEKYWPTPIAKTLIRAYSKSEQSNKIK